MSNPAVPTFAVEFCESVIHPLKFAAAVHSSIVTFFQVVVVPTHNLSIAMSFHTGLTLITSEAHCITEIEFQEPAFLISSTLEVSEPFNSS